MLFVRSKFFRKKNCPDNLIYYIPDVYPYQPTYRGFISKDLFLFVIICKNLLFLWESYLSVRISSYCQNLLESLSFVWIYIFMKTRKQMIPSFKTNLLSSKHDNDILLILYVPSLCFLLWILLILCLITFLLNKVSLN